MESNGTVRSIFRSRVLTRETYTQKWIEISRGGKENNETDGISQKPTAIDPGFTNFEGKEHGENA